MISVDFTDVAELAERFGRVLRRELRCHPDVAKWLMLTLPEAQPEFPFTGAIGSLTGVPVIEQPDFEPGAWEILEDGEVTASGRIDVPSLVTEPVTFDVEFPATGRLSHLWPYGSFPVRSMALPGGIC